MQQTLLSFSSLKLRLIKGNEAAGRKARKRIIRPKPAAACQGGFSIARFLLGSLTQGTDDDETGR